MASQGVTAAARAVGAAKEQKEELVLDRDSFSKETTVVAVKVPAKRTRCALRSAFETCVVVFARRR